MSEHQAQVPRLLMARSLLRQLLMAVHRIQRLVNKQLRLPRGDLPDTHAHETAELSKLAEHVSLHVRHSKHKASVVGHPGVPTGCTVSP